MTENLASLALARVDGNVVRPSHGLTLTGADRTRKEYRTRDTGGAVGARPFNRFGERPELRSQRGRENQKTFVLTGS